MKVKDIVLHENILYFFIADINCVTKYDNSNNRLNEKEKKKMKYVHEEFSTLKYTLIDRNSNMNDALVLSSTSQ